MGCGDGGRSADAGGPHEQHLGGSASARRVLVVPPPSPDVPVDEICLPSMPALSHPGIRELERREVGYGAG